MLVFFIFENNNGFPLFHFTGFRYCEDRITDLILQKNSFNKQKHKKLTK
jgi:hypothetical protein